MAIHTFTYARVLNGRYTTGGFGLWSYDRALEQERTVCLEMIQKVQSFEDSRARVRAFSYFPHRERPLLAEAYNRFEDVGNARGGANFAVNGVFGKGLTEDGYVISLYGNDLLPHELHDDAMPDYYPELTAEQLNRARGSVLSAARVSDFTRIHRHEIVTILNALLMHLEDDKKIFIVSDDPTQDGAERVALCMAAVLMLLPRRIANTVPFATMLTEPCNRDHPAKLVGVLKGMSRYQSLEGSGTVFCLGDRITYAYEYQPHPLTDYMRVNASFSEEFSEYVGDLCDQTSMAADLSFWINHYRLDRDDSAEYRSVAQFALEAYGSALDVRIMDESRRIAPLFFVAFQRRCGFGDDGLIEAMPVTVALIRKIMSANRSHKELRACVQTILQTVMRPELLATYGTDGGASVRAALGEHAKTFETQLRNCVKRRDAETESEELRALARDDNYLLTDAFEYFFDIFFQGFADPALRAMAALFAGKLFAHEERRVPMADACLEADAQGVATVEFFNAETGGGRRMIEDDVFRAYLFTRFREKNLMKSVSVALGSKQGYDYTVSKLLDELWVQPVVTYAEIEAMAKSAMHYPLYRPIFEKRLCAVLRMSKDALTARYEDICRRGDPTEAKQNIAELDNFRTYLNAQTARISDGIFGELVQILDGYRTQFTLLMDQERVNAAVRKNRVEFLLEKLNLLGKKDIKKLFAAFDLELDESNEASGVRRVAEIFLLSPQTDSASKRAFSDELDRLIKARQLYCDRLSLSVSGAQHAANLCIAAAFALLIGIGVSFATQTIMGWTYFIIPLVALPLVTSAIGALLYFANSRIVRKKVRLTVTLLLTASFSILISVSYFGAYILMSLAG